MHVGGAANAASAPEAPELALAETTQVYDASPEEFGAYQWQADFGTYLDDFAALVPDAQYPLLDAGCGTGRDVMGLVDRGFACIGADLSSGLLEQARQRVRNPAATWIRADMRALPLPTASVGGVWCNSALLHLGSSGQLAALREFRRVLVKGRPLFISTMAGDGWTTRQSGEGGGRRWFWGTDPDRLAEQLEAADFHIISVRAERGLIQGEWVNAYALAGSRRSAASVANT